MSDFIAVVDNGMLKLLALTLLVGYAYRVYNRSKYWPPGPRGLPILGNIFQISKFPFRTFSDWTAQYGPVISLNLAGQPMIILNSHKAASDLFSRRSSKYSDRPRFIMASEIMTGGLMMGFMSYTDQWRRLRRAAHEGLNIQAVIKYRPVQEIEAARLANSLLHDPDNWENHFKRSAASTVLCYLYGWDPIEPKDDPLVERINDIIHRMARAALPGAYLVEIFPLMKHLPTWMAKWKREGLEWFAKDTDLFSDFISDVEKRATTGTCRPCFVSSLLESQHRLKLVGKEATWLPGTLFGGGSETTSSTMCAFMLAMVLYPDVIREAQAELDEVVGRDRLPTFADYDKLPYIRAMVKEVLRWRPVAPLAVPRFMAEDDWYEGYYIPKGALVVSNIWAMNRDPELYPDYDEFRPSRFLNASREGRKDASDTTSLGHFSFGFGRRVCVGMNLANQSLFINIACILWALNIEQATDSQGNKIVPPRDDLIDDGLVVRPAPFVCKVTARSSDAIAVLEQTKKDSIVG